MPCPPCFLRPHSLVFALSNYSARQYKRIFMRLHKVTINNFRKLKNCTINFRDTTFLIGPNNAGKSSVFAALDYLHKDKNVTREEYTKTYNQETESYHYEEQIEIVAEYRNVPDAADDWAGFRGRVLDCQDPLHGENSRSIIYKKVWSITETRPKFFILEHHKRPKAEFSACKKPVDLIGAAFTEELLSAHFGEDNLNKGLTTAAIREKLSDLTEYWEVDRTVPPEWVENPGGIPGNILSKLPRIVVIPAESGAAELTSPGGALHGLLGELFHKVRESSENYTEAQRLLNLLAEELDPTDEATDFGRLIQNLNSMAHNIFPDSSIHVTASLDQPEKAIKPQFTVEMQSNVRTAVNYQGHGMIRATVFQLLRYVHEIVNQQADVPRTTIFCFEEPEIYLHPAAANQMRDVLYDLSGLNCQIVATTHSPYMINLGSDKSLSLTKFSFTQENFTTCKSFNLEDAFINLQANEQQNLKMLLKTDDYISRMFFAKKSIFIEGDTEEVVIRETIKRLSTADKSRVVGNCEFLRARGKSVLISVAKYLNALDMNYIIMHDRDGNTPGALVMNEPILSETGADRRIMIEECIEDMLGYPAPEREKPFEAYAHIQSNWGANFSDLPPTWKRTFITICAPYIDHLGVVN